MGIITSPWTRDIFPLGKQDFCWKCWMRGTICFEVSEVAIIYITGTSSKLTRAKGEFTPKVRLQKESSRQGLWSRNTEQSNNGCFCHEIHWNSMMLEVRETPSGSVNNACHLKIGLWKLPPELLLLVLSGRSCISAEVETSSLLQSERHLHGTVN